MDSLQEQVSILHLKVDALQQMIERLSERVAEVFTDAKLSAGGEAIRSHSGGGYSRHGHSSRTAFDAAMEHKDILIDTDYPDHDAHTGERSLSPEIQIQRLTAQLTAAYNRIAALEEQLFAHRIH